MKKHRREVEKIYKKIEKIASKGKDNYLEFVKYINETISKSNYSLFEEVLFIYYNIDVTDSISVDDYKKSAWVKICEKTDLSFLKELKKVHDKYQVYQLSQDIYQNEIIDDGIKPIRIGYIKEIDQKSSYYNYYVKNNQYARLIGELVTYLEVGKESSESSIVIDYTDDRLTEERNLLKRYQIAIEYLLDMD